MANPNGNKVSIARYIWIIPLFLFFGLLSAWRPGLVIAFLIMAILFIAAYHYLHTPILEGEDYNHVYTRKLAAICVLMYMFLPHLFYKLGDLGLVIEFGVPLAVFAYTIYYILRNNDFKWKISKSNLWMAFAIASVVLSMIWGYAAKGVPSNPRDILAIKDPFFLFLMFIVFFQQEWSPDDVRRYFLVPLISGGIVVAAIGIIQYFYIPGLNRDFFVYWTEKTHLEELMKPYSRRIFSTLYSSGSLSIFLVFLLTHLIASFYSVKGARRILMIFGFMLALVALFMTATKGSFIIFLLMIFIFPLVYFTNARTRLIYSGATVVAFALFVIVFLPLIRDTYMFQRMQSVYLSGRSLIGFVEEGKRVRWEEVFDETAIGRVAPWVRSWPNIAASPILGYGPGKTYIRQLGLHYKEELEYKNPFESSYLQIMFKYGLIGFFVNFGLVIHFLLIQRGVLRMKDCPIELHRVASVHIIFGLLLFLIFFNTDCIFNINLMAPLYASAGIGSSFLLANRN